MQMEHDSTTNVYTYAKLHHQKRPGCWQSADDLRQIYRILAHLPPDLELLKCTEIRTELDDLTTVTPDLYSKICSNGNISSSLNANPNGMPVNGGMGGGAATAGNAQMLLNGSGSSASTTGGGSGGGGDGMGGGTEEEFSVVVTESEVATNIDV